MNENDGLKALSIVIAVVLIACALTILFQCTPIMVEEVGKTTVKILDDVERDIAEEIIHETEIQPNEAPQEKPPAPATENPH